MGQLFEQYGHLLHDTHCHLHLYKNAKEIARELTDKNFPLHLMTTNIKEYKVELQEYCEYPGIQVAAGFFPCFINELYPRLDEYLELIQQTRFVGEVGLDYVTTDEEERRKQRNAFEKILEVSAAQGDRIISIHSRRASADVLEMIGENFPGFPILHWFSGKPEEIKPDVYYSINTAMISSRRSKELIKKMSPEQVLLETDGPYVELGENPAKPQDLTRVLESLAHIWDLDLENTADQLHTNYTSLRHDNLECNK